MLEPSLLSTKELRHHVSLKEILQRVGTIDCSPRMARGQQPMGGRYCSPKATTWAILQPEGHNVGEIVARSNTISARPTRQDCNSKVLKTYMDFFKKIKNVVQTSFKEVLESFRKFKTSFYKLSRNFLKMFRNFLKTF